MKLAWGLLCLLLLSCMNNVFARTSFQEEFKHQLLHGDLSDPEVKLNLKKKLRGMRGRKRALRALESLDRNYHDVLDMSLSHGLSGRQVLAEALDSKNVKLMNEMYASNKDFLRAAYSGKELKRRAFEKTMNELHERPEFQFLFFENTDKGLFTIVNEACQSRFGEENFHLLIFGFNRCWSEGFRVDRWTIGPGYYYASQGATRLVGLKIAAKSFKGLGVRVQIGVIEGVGVSVHIGNGFMITMDLDKANGVYAGITYLNMKAR